MHAIEKILHYMKSSPYKGLLWRKKGNFGLEDIY